MILKKKKKKGRSVLLLEKSSVVSLSSFIYFEIGVKFSGQLES